MRSLRLSARLSLLTLGLVLLPLAALAAANVSDVLKTPDASLVSRGEFIRAAVKVLGITGGTSAKLPYRRVPKDLEEVVRAAYAADALQTFGNNLASAQPITRGQALEVIVALQHLTGEPTQQYRDAKAKDTLARAVQIAVDQGWMEPNSQTLFGVQEVLTGREGRLFLRKVLGEGGEQEEESPESIPTISIRFTQKSTSSAGASQLPKAQILEALWRIINEDYLHADRINEEDAAYSAAEALVKSLNDSYSTFYRPAGSRAFQSQIQGEVSGIGAKVEEKDGVLTIVAPMPDSPAEKAGLKPGDQILAVNGEKIVGLPYEEMVDRVRGPKGTMALLKIRRNGTEFDVSVTRDTIKINEIEISWQGRVAVVHLTQFGKLTETDLRAKMADIQKQNPEGVILDLRNNPGGLLHAASLVASNFLPKGSAVAQIRARAGDRTEATADEPTIDASVPVVVLVNKGSASASEIVAGALQDSKRATILGEQTFGKGTVQEVLEFNDKSSLKLTIAEWLTPAGNKIDGIGVKPDVVVPTGERDDQLVRAIELIQRGKR